jgi:hypothetical protein
MSVDAPAFQPPTSPPKQHEGAATNADSEGLLKYNIAQMYQYYNSLIFRKQRTATDSQPKRGVPRIGDPNLFNRSNSFQEGDLSPELEDLELKMKKAHSHVVNSAEKSPKKAGRHSEIEVRYSTKELLRIFKSLGRY